MAEVVIIISDSELPGIFFDIDVVGLDTDEKSTAIVAGHGVVKILKRIQAEIYQDYVDQVAQQFKQIAAEVANDDVV